MFYLLIYGNKLYLFYCILSFYFFRLVNISVHIYTFTDRYNDFLYLKFVVVWFWHQASRSYDFDLQTKEQY